MIAIGIHFFFFFVTVEMLELPEVFEELVLADFLRAFFLREGALLAFLILPLLAADFFLVCVLRFFIGIGLSPFKLLTGCK